MLARHAAAPRSPGRSWRRSQRARPGRAAVPPGPPAGSAAADRHHAPARSGEARSPPHSCWAARGALWSVGRRMDACIMMMV